MSKKEYTFGEALHLIEDNPRLKFKSSEGELLEYNSLDYQYYIDNSTKIHLTEYIQRAWYKEPVYLTFMDAVNTREQIRYSGRLYAAELDSDGSYFGLDEFMELLGENLFPSQIREVLVSNRFEVRRWGEKDE